MRLNLTEIKEKFPSVTRSDYVEVYYGDKPLGIKSDTNLLEYDTLYGTGYELDSKFIASNISFKVGNMEYILHYYNDNGSRYNLIKMYGNGLAESYTNLSLLAPAELVEEVLNKALLKYTDYGYLFKETIRLVLEVYSKQYKDYYN